MDGLSLIIPCYNEGKIIRDSINEILKIFNILKYKWEIIFVDDGSTDGTVNFIKELLNSFPNMKLITHEKNLGRGKTVQDGILSASYNIVGYLDIDLEVHARYIPCMISEIENGIDIAVGYRFLKVTLNNLHRFILSRGYNLLIKKLLKVNLNDTESGFKFFNKSNILPILSKMKYTGWFWDTEIMVLAYKKGLKIVEVPVLFIKRKDKKSSVRIIRDTFFYFKNLVTFWKELRLDKYD